MYFEEFILLQKLSIIITLYLIPVLNLLVWWIRLRWSDFGWEELSTCTMEYNEQNIVNYFDICTELLSILIWKIEVNEFYLFNYLLHLTY